MMIPKFRYIPFLILLLLLSPALVLAETFTSESYKIEMGTFNVTGGRKNSGSYNLTDTVGQNSPGLYSNQGYIIKSGFQYLYEQQSAFTFTIDNLDINLGTLIPGIGATQSNIITITTPSGRGYQILAQQNHPLALESGTTIPDTACDSGCTPSSSGVWQSDTAYGFGFNAIGIDENSLPTGVGTSSFFTDSTDFRPFSSASPPPGLPAQVIMSENSRVENHSAKITYKALISPLQSVGYYQNAISFTAVPIY